MQTPTRMWRALLQGVSPPCPKNDLMDSRAGLVSSCVAATTLRFQKQVWHVLRPACCASSCAFGPSASLPPSMQVPLPHPLCRLPRLARALRVVGAAHPACCVPRCFLGLAEQHRVRQHAAASARAAPAQQREQRQRTGQPLLCALPTGQPPRRQLRGQARHPAVRQRAGRPATNVSRAAGAVRCWLTPVGAPRKP